MFSNSNRFDGININNIRNIKMTEEKELEKELEKKVEELDEGKQKVEEEKPSEFEKQLKALREDNERMQAELLKQEELKAKILLGGRAEAGQPQKSQLDLDQEEAAMRLKEFQ